MTDLERRALLGDKQAREECTRRGIVLACPFCGGEKAKVRHACGDYFVECLKCHCTSSVTSTKETVVNDWNTRPAPPIGQCWECDEYNTSGCSDGCGWCQEWNVGKSDEGFCDKFKLKGG